METKGELGGEYMPAKRTISLMDEELYELLQNMREAMAEELGLRKLTWDDFFRKLIGMDEE